MKFNKNKALEKYSVARAPLIKYIRAKKIMFYKKSLQYQFLTIPMSSLSNSWCAINMIPKFLLENKKLYGNQINLLTLIRLIKQKNRDKIKKQSERETGRKDSKTQNLNPDSGEEQQQIIENHQIIKLYNKLINSNMIKTL